MELITQWTTPTEWAMEDQDHGTMEWVMEDPVPGNTAMDLSTMTMVTI